MGGSLGDTLGQNQVQEATVISTGYSSQFGGAAGGNKWKRAWVSFILSGDCQKL